MIPLTVPEVRRLLLALAEPPERFRFRLGWSYWRRRHQAVARRCHTARRERRWPTALFPPDAPKALPGEVTLTEAQWARIAPLLPPQQPPVGRPMLDHRRVVAGMLWIERTGAAWRELPARFGQWPTVYSRYRRWRGNGLWQRITEVLQHAEAGHA